MFATPEEAERAFYDALEHADLLRLMQVWADDEEIACIHPGGFRLVGLRSVQESWQQIFTNGPLRIRAQQPVAMQNMLTAVHVVIEQLNVRTPAGLQARNCYTTNIYHKGLTGWCMIMRHASLAPSEAGMLDLHDVPDRLH